MGKTTPLQPQGLGFEFFSIFFTTDEMDEKKYNP
jgi:hypothetical protein